MSSYLDNFDKDDIENIKKIALILMEKYGDKDFNKGIAVSLTSKSEIEKMLTFLEIRQNISKKDVLEKLVEIIGEKGNG